MRQQAKNRFSGGLDTDSDVRDVANVNYIDAFNIRNRFGNAENIRSNAKIEYELPEGSNYCIGAVEDEICNTLIYFIWNINSEHLILRYYFNTKEIKEVAKGSFLNFKKEWRIHSATVLDGKFLYWTDAVPNKFGMEGNPPRKINLEKATETKFCYLISIINVQPNDRFDMTITDESGTTTFEDFFIAPNPPSNEDYTTKVLRDLGIRINFRLNNAPYNSGATYEVCSDESLIKVCVDTEGIEINIISDKIKVVPDNHYTELNERIISVIKPQPSLPLKAYLHQNEDKYSSNIIGHSLQFIHRYIYDDREKSAWSTATPVLTNYKRKTLVLQGINPPDPGTSFKENYYYNSPDFNEVKLSIVDPIFLEMKDIIRGVEIGVRYDEFDVYRSAGVFLQSEFGNGGLEITFDNTKALTVIPSDDNGTADQQVFKPYDFTPLLTASIEQVVSEDGLSRIAYYCNLENRKELGCNPAKVYIVDYPRFVDVEYDKDVEDLLMGVTNLNSMDQVSYSHLKKGGYYSMAVTFKDYYGRALSAQFIDEVVIPRQYATFPVVVPEVEAPSWAHSYAILITKNQNQSSYYQFKGGTVYWGLITNEKSSTKFHTYGNEAITHLVVRIRKAVNEESDNIIFEEMVNGTWKPEQGDFISINAFDEDDYVGLEPQKAYEYQISGYSIGFPTETVGFEQDIFLFVEFREEMPNFGSIIYDDHRVELYRKKTSSDELYYEVKSGLVEEWNNNVGETLIYQNNSSIEDATLGDSIVQKQLRRKWSGNGISLEAVGDTYIGYNVEYIDNTQIDAYAVYFKVESPRLHRESTRTGGDHGKPFAVDDDFQQLYSYSQIRLTDVYSYQGVNGLSSFRGTEYVIIDREFGIGRKLEMVGNVLLAIAENKTQPIYIGKGELLDLSGNTTIGRTDKLLNIANEFQKRLGTQNPESIINEEGRVYCWDSKQGVVWRYTSGGGQFEISEVGMRNEFLSRRNFNGFVKGGFERKYNTYYLSFEGDFTFGFQEGAREERPKWTCRFEWNPDAYGLVSNEFITIKTGELWVHEQSSTGLIYGQPVQSFITFVVNEVESAIKLFWRIEQSSSSLWYASVISTLPDELYPIGMESELIANKWKSYEGHYKADFLRDANDPSQKFLLLPSPTRRVRAMLEGRKLRGEVLIITLYLQNPNELSILRETNTYFSFSEQTSK